MDAETLRQVIREELALALASIEVELVSVCAGHMATTHYWLVVKHQGKTVTTLCVGNDGFNDGAQQGWSFDSSRSVRSELDL